jgi:hypothetical protein
MFTPNINVFVIIIGQDVTNKIPYITNNIAPIELMIRNVLMFFIKNEIINTNDAK